MVKRIAQPRWLARVLMTVHGLSFQRRIRFTHKAFSEIGDLGLDEDGACGIIEDLRREDFHDRLISDQTGEWMYVFKLCIGGLAVYLKLILRDDCIVVSFHEDYEP